MGNEAVTQRIQQDGEWRDGETSFFKVNVWRGQAERLADSLSKGDGSWSPSGGDFDDQPPF
jgi:single-stranded DNA-binding protein